jgi:cob(I)alamin adenosyltransferase
MVTLSRIYTRTGDEGNTRLADNSPVPKSHIRVEAYGTVDELNAVLGLVVACGVQPANAQVLQRVQNELFDLGADLAYPQAEEEAPCPVLRVTEAQVRRLEEEIDQLNTSLSSLHSFVLPGGSRGAAWLHLGRTVCRRAERRAWELAGQTPVNPQALIFLNRLSDLLFVMARVENQGGAWDLLWEAGKSQGAG